MRIIPAFERERQEDPEFKASFGHIANFRQATADAVSTKQANKEKPKRSILWEMPFKTK